jgi:tetratricopeptide (TPR) repeat protein
MSNVVPFALYNPALLPPDVLLSEFTARRPLLAKLLDVIRANEPGEPPQHVLVVGPRGMGKTTLLWAIAASLSLREPELARAWQAVPFDEESRRIGDLADFWLECIRQWESATEPRLSTNHSPRIAALLARPGPNLEDQARDTFLRLVDASGKRALLLVDNLNDVFSAIHDPEALLRLRSFLMADPRVMIIGAATRWFTEVTALDKPFYEFFRPFDLHPLNLEEMRACLAGVAEARGDEKVLHALKNRAGTIEALHLLTGGNPRLIRTFYRLLAEGMNGELRQQLERLIDDYTPYHKAIIDALPAQQQRVLDAVALHWNPCDVATVANATRLPSNQVSAQIKALIKSGLVSEAPALGTGKKKAYLLTDRFSNIHYLMRHGRAGRLKLHWYVMTLRSLFDDHTFADSVAKAVKQSSQTDEGLLLATNALSCAGSELARQRLFDRLTGSKEFDTEVDVILAEKICRQALIENPDDALAHFKWGRLLHIHLKRYAEAEIAYRNAAELDPAFASPWHNLGNLLIISLNRSAEAETAYQRAIELDPKGAASWNNLGHLLANHLNRYDEAETAYHRAIECDPTDASPWHNLGILFAAYLKRPSEAEPFIRKAIELNPKESNSWMILGLTISAVPNRSTEAEAALRQAISLNSNSALAHGSLAAFLTRHSPIPTEALVLATKGLLCGPNLASTQHIFRHLCFTSSTHLRDVIPSLAQWCSQHPATKVKDSINPDDTDSPHAFALDAWLAYARVTSASTARELLDAQPEEVRLAFELVRDAFVAHDDSEHLHRLAPERRALVLRLLERLRVTNAAK